MKPRRDRLLEKQRRMLRISANRNIIVICCLKGSGLRSREDGIGC